MKVNVANYLIGNMSSRFPIKNRASVDREIIDVMVDNWSKNQFSGADINISFCDARSRKEKYLM